MVSRIMNTSRPSSSPYLTGEIWISVNSWGVYDEWAKFINSVANVYKWEIDHNLMSGLNLMYTGGR